MRFLSISPRLLLPLILVMGVLIIGMRIDDIWQAAEEGHLFSRTAQAQTSASAAPNPAPTPSAPSTATDNKDAAAATPASASMPADTGTATGNVSKPSSDTASLPTPAVGAPAADEDMSPAEMEVLKQLSTRREALDRRGRDLDTRESLIKVAEQRVDKKIKEMESMRQQLQSMVNQVSEGQQQQLDNLVKIYETMKPEEAAHIFESLEMPTLLQVVLRMKPKSTAPIMAKMAPDKAKELTVALTKQDQLPQIK